MLNIIYKNESSKERLESNRYFMIAYITLGTLTIISTLKNMKIHRKRKSYSRYGHQPTLRTVRMVERVLRSKRFVNSRNHLYFLLPKKVMQQTLSVILGYLEESNKIIFEEDGSIAWTFVKTSKALKTSERQMIIESKLTRCIEIRTSI